MMPDFTTSQSVDRRLLLKSAAFAAALGIGGGVGEAQAAVATKPAGGPKSLTGKTIGLMLGHEQFTGPQLTEIGAAAANAGFQLLATSDHFQPWQANEGHSSQAWVTMGALGGRIGDTWMGTTVTCPTLRYNPAVVAEAFAPARSGFEPGLNADASRKGRWFASSLQASRVPAHLSQLDAYAWRLSESDVHAGASEPMHD